MVVEAMDPAGVRVKEEEVWVPWVIAWRLMGGILIGDYSECFFGYGRR